MNEQGRRKFQILSLDGGGIKGLYSAAVLANLEADLGINIADHFDLITGTSTGGIIALGLGLGLRPREIVQFYASHGSKIFPSGWIASARQFVRRKFDQEPLRESLRKCLGDKRLADSRKRLVVPSYNLDKDEVYVFKTPHHERLRRDWQVPMWKVGLATSAAPTYFPVCSEVDCIRLIDGGLWANNPTMVGIVEAVSLLSVPIDAISVFSLGTTNSLAAKSNRLNHGGFFQWRKAGIDAALRGQSHGVQGQALLLLGQERAIRLDPAVPDGLFDLDRLTEDRLLSEAAHASRNFAPCFSDTFLPHAATNFTPLYS